MKKNLLGGTRKLDNVLITTYNYDKNDPTTDDAGIDVITSTIFSHLYSYIDSEKSNELYYKYLTNIEFNNMSFQEEQLIATKKIIGLYDQRVIYLIPYDKLIEKILR